MLSGLPPPRHQPRRAEGDSAARPFTIITSVHEEYQDADLFRSIPPPETPGPLGRDGVDLKVFIAGGSPATYLDPGHPRPRRLSGLLGLRRRERHLVPRAARPADLDHPRDPRALHRHRGLHLRGGRARRSGGGRRRPLRRSPRVLLLRCRPIGTTTTEGTTTCGAARPTPGKGADTTGSSTRARRSRPRRSGT